jgi:hypothetical protein
MTIQPPAANPCGSCPYRRDVPSGVWDAEEYEKLPEYDNDTATQPPGVFLCHQQNGRACAGWAGCHDMTQSLGVRLACSVGAIEDVDAFFDFKTDIPLWATGEEAAAHGVESIQAPDAEAQKIIDKLLAKRNRR